MSDRYVFVATCEDCTDMVTGDRAVRLGYTIFENGDPSYHGMPTMYWGKLSEKDVIMMRGMYVSMLGDMEAAVEDTHGMDEEEMVAVERIGINMFVALNDYAAGRIAEKKKKKDRKDKRDNFGKGRGRK